MELWPLPSPWEAQQNSGEGAAAHPCLAEVLGEKHADAMAFLVSWTTETLLLWDTWLSPGVCVHLSRGSQPGAAPQSSCLDPTREA